MEILFYFFEINYAAHGTDISLRNSFLKSKHFTVFNTPIYDLFNSLQHDGV